MSDWRLLLLLLLLLLTPAMPEPPSMESRARLASLSIESGPSVVRRFCIDIVQRFFLKLTF